MSDLFDVDTGVVALDLDLMRRQGIPQSQHFPWDDSKGLYVLNGYHCIHCIVSADRE